MNPSAHPQDPFERRLAAIPPAPVPEDWRDSILGAAHAAAAEARDSRCPRVAWVWRTPWTVLAGAWAVVAALLVVQRAQESQLRPSQSLAVSPAMPDPSWSLAARAYRRELLSLIDSADTSTLPLTDPQPTPPPPLAPPAVPRSELRRRTPLDTQTPFTLPA